MTWVKICGMTNLEDALTAVDAGANAVGFVFYEKSPRKVDVETAKRIAQKLPEGVERIGVFVDDGARQLDVMAQAALTGIQSYVSAESGGNGDFLRVVKASSLPSQTRFLTALPVSLMAADAEGVERLRDVFSEWKRILDQASPTAERMMGTFVLDSGDLRTPGGTGKVFDWRKAVPLAEAMREEGARLVVAGGLTPENVGEAMEILQPWGVDVVSGVEARPGKKDPEKVRAFVNAVREIDRQTA
jgi:phosphoribosylanthranilate isomerase